MDEDQLLYASSTSCELICAALEQDGYGDLSPFRSFPSERAGQIICRLQRIGQLTTLNVSNCTHITAADLKNVASIGSKLHTLYALEIPQVPLETILSLLILLQIRLLEPTTLRFIELWQAMG